MDTPTHIARRHMPVLNKASHTPCFPPARKKRPVEPHRECPRHESSARTSGAENARQGRLRRLDAIADHRHVSYKVIGLLTWLTLAASLLTTLIYPRLFLIFAKAFALYLLVRLVSDVCFYLVGLARCRHWEACAAAEANAPDPQGETESVHHVVIIPNYQEPPEVLSRTLESLARQKDASRRLTIVLAMEERERGAYEKARKLRNRFADRFAHILITMHPDGLAGEAPGKGSNQAWAARQAKRELVDRLGIPIERMTLTSCDADSVLHPHYFATLSRLFINDPDRHHRFWYAPVFYYNNIWHVPAPIRLMAYPSCATRLGELANPLFRSLPVSTYTLSFKLADDMGYWDPAVIAEDWHIYLRCFFGTGGKISLTPIYLPTTMDAVDGESLWQALVSYYRQQVRHAWGAEDVGYILQQWTRSPDTPWHKKLGCFLWILHLHSLRSTSWFIVALGILASALSYEASLAVPSEHPLIIAVKYVGFLWVLCCLIIWAIERFRISSDRKPHRSLLLAQEIASWALLPLLSLVFTALPGLHAQTKMLIGSPLVYRQTLKRIA